MTHVYENLGDLAEQLRWFAAIQRRLAVGVSGHMREELLAKAYAYDDAAAHVNNSVIKSIS